MFLTEAPTPIPPSPLWWHHHPTEVAGAKRKWRLAIGSSTNFQRLAGWWLTNLPMVGNILLILMVNINGYHMVNKNLVGGWALPLWKIWVRQMGLLFPIWWGSHKIHVPNHQPVSELVIKDLKILRLVIQRYPKYHKISELVIQRLDFTKKIWGNPTDLTLSRIRSKDIQSTVPSGKLT